MANFPFAEVIILTCAFVSIVDCSWPDGPKRLREALTISEENTWMVTSGSSPADPSSSKTVSKKNESSDYTKTIDTLHRIPKTMIVKADEKKFEKAQTTAEWYGWNWKKEKHGSTSSAPKEPQLEKITEETLILSHCFKANNKGASRDEAAHYALITQIEKYALYKELGTEAAVGAFEVTDADVVMWFIVFLLKLKAGFALGNADQIKKGGRLSLGLQADLDAYDKILMQYRLDDSLHDKDSKFWYYHFTFPNCRNELVHVYVYRDGKDGKELLQYNLHQLMTNSEIIKFIRGVVEREKFQKYCLGFTEIDREKKPVFYFQ